MIETKKILITGLVQGVGFRPFIYRIANKNEIKGTVENTNFGVIINTQSNKENISNFLSDITELKPPASVITDIIVEEYDSESFDKFEIIKSSESSNHITQVSPDIAVCKDCLEDIKKQKHRINYPLTNCTNCGPRFSIIKDIPYDRDKTTMAEFEMCEICKNEYNDVLNRRFHAQPVSCNNCGPKYKLKYKNKYYDKFDEILNITSNIINNKGTALIKGIGGYFITANALDYNSVQKIRDLKLREKKPFATMAKNINAAKKYVSLNSKEIELLQSFRSPVVLSKLCNNDLPKNINYGLNSLGIILPYMPFHHLLFENLNTDLIIFTSGNISDEPILIDDTEAENKFGNKTDIIISYNREIYNRTDDSVVSVFNNRDFPIRRSRGYTPEPIITNLNTEGIFAAGAELVNTFAIGKSNQILVSQHIGDLKNFETFKFYKESYSRFSKLFKFKPDLVVFDMHPDYMSTKFSKSFDNNKISVQHHHAHMASCMAENNLDEKVIGVIMDGTGLGYDGNIWGSEFFTGDFENVKREFHFDYVPLPGGDKSIFEPWRISYSYLKKYSLLDRFDFEKIDSVNKDKIKMINQMIDKKINSPLSCGAGRLFDSISALTGLCTHSDFHSQAPMLLESIINNNSNEKYNYNIDKNIIKFNQTFSEILNDFKNKITINKISIKFHNTIISIIFEIVMILSKKYNLKKVVLSGGSFQNRYLTENIISKLSEKDLEIYYHSKVPSNDAGISLGQLAIASKRRNKNVS